MARVVRAACLGGLLQGLILGNPATTLAVASPDYPSAIVVYPYVIVDSATGHDTMIRLSNVHGSPIDVRCFWEDATPTCVDGQDGETCVPEPSACSGTCIGESAFSMFSLRLETRQPLAWSAARGEGAIQSLRDPFVGALRCVAFDEDGTPSDRNVLIGSATIRRQVSGDDSFDDADYGAIGIRAIEGAVDDDEVLVLGGPEPEYEGCPFVSIVNHFFDGAVLFFDGVDANARQVSTRFVLSRCGQDFAAEAQDVDMLVINEFSDRQELTANVAYHEVLELTSVEGKTGPLFAIESQGTLTGQTRLFGESRLLVLGLETYRDEATGKVKAAVLRASSQGESVAAEMFHLDVPVPPTATPTPTLTPTNTPTPEPRDCCAANGARGCDVPACESCVCGIDSPCCASLWDGQCADIAIQECQDDCLCPQSCTGDCDGDGAVRVDEVITSTNVALMRRPMTDCEAIDGDKNGSASVDELVASVENLIEGCR
jgi:hypothetical protein